MATKQEKKKAIAAAKAKQREQKRIANQQQQGLVDYGQHKKADWRHSTNDQLVRLPKYKPEQQRLFDMINQGLAQGKFPQNSYFAGVNLPGKDPYAGFQGIENKARSDFYRKTAPSIAERFAGLGSGVANTDPGVYNAIASAGQGLDSQLGALRAQYGLQNQRDQFSNLQNLLGTGLTQQYDLSEIPGQNSGVRNAAQFLAKSAPGIIAGGLTGGGAGAGIAALNAFGGGEIGDALQQRRGMSLQNMQQPQQYNQQSTNSFNNQTNPYMNPSINPMGVGNAITQGYYNQNAVPGFGPQSQLNPYEITNSTVRGFGNRIY